MGVASVSARLRLPDAQLDTRADAAAVALGCKEGGTATVVVVGAGTVTGVVVATGAVVVGAVVVGPVVDVVVGAEAGALVHADATAATPSAEAVIASAAFHLGFLRIPPTSPLWQTVTRYRSRLVRDPPATGLSAPVTSVGRSQAPTRADAPGAAAGAQGERGPESKVTP